VRRETTVLSQGCTARPRRETGAPRVVLALPEGGETDHSRDLLRLANPLSALYPRARHEERGLNVLRLDVPRQVRK